jgi:hypothetical protein
MLTKLSYSYWGVFWVDASSKESLEAGFAALGQEVGVGSNAGATMHWFFRSRQPWLLILDNADDPELDLSRYLPVGLHGHILITTRNPNAVEHGTVGYMSLRGMDPEEAINLLLKAASSKAEITKPTPGERTLAQAIASELGYLALALTHAGSTIRRKIYTLERYLDFYLGHRRITSSRYHSMNGAEEAIITTWEIPFQRIVNHTSTAHQDAVDLLHIFAFMHFDSVPAEIFERSRNTVEGSDIRSSNFPSILQVAWNEEVSVRFRRAIGILRDYSLVDYEATKHTCSLHPVIHRWARERLDEDKQRQWLGCAMTILSHCVSPHLEASGRLFRRSLLPHMESCHRVLKLLSLRYPGSAEAATAIESFASVYAENGLWTTARSLQREVLDYRTKRFCNRFSEHTIRAQRNLGQIYWNLFEIEKASLIHKERIKLLWVLRPSWKDWVGRRFIFPTHTAYCACLSDLTMTLWLAGMRNLSKHTGERAVAGFKERLGPEDPETLTAMFNLARTYLHLGDYTQCHTLLVFVLKRRRHLFGPDHPDTLMTRNELGILFCARRQHLAAAESLVANVLEARRRVLGEEHAYTLWSINDLSKILCERGRANEAAKMLEDIVPVVIRTLGEDHVGLVMTRTNLTRAYCDSNRLEEAQQVNNWLLTSVKPEHPDWVHIVFGNMRIQIRLGEIEEAETTGKLLLDKITRDKILALNSRRTIAIAEELWKIYKAQDRVTDIAALKKHVPLLDESKLMVQG